MSAEADDGSTSDCASGCFYSVGYALHPKKEKSFILPSLLDHAKRRGILLVRVDPSTPLADQGPFHCIIHKLSDEAWKHQLRRFSSERPGVPIIDPIESIEPLHDRVSMLQVVTRLTPVSAAHDPMVHADFDVGIPKQALVQDPEALLAPDPPGGLCFPIVAKPLVVDGSLDSHEMHLVFSMDGLRKLSAPVVLQEFLNHGGVVFKVYVAGGHVRCVKRSSLPDITIIDDNHSLPRSSVPFSQISNKPAAAADADADADAGTGSCEEDGGNSGVDLEGPETPPLSSVRDLGRRLGEAMGLSLFNFDLIRDYRYEKKYLVIDINYFPGYEKLPCFESVLTDFFWDITHKKKKNNINNNANNAAATAASSSALP